MQAKKERVAPRLVGSMRVNEMLGLAGRHVSQEPLADILEGVGIDPAGEDGNGNFRWSEKAVEGALERIKRAVEKWRAIQEMNGSVRGWVEVEAAVLRVVEAHVLPAQEDVDEALEKIQEQHRGLFRLMGEVAELARDTLRVANGIVKDVRSDNAALKMMLERRIDSLEKSHGEGFQLIAEEIETHTRCIGELRKALKP